MAHLDFREEIEQILVEGSRRYIKDDIPPKERIEFSLLAEKSGLASYGTRDLETNQEYLVVSSKNCHDRLELDESTWPVFLARFSSYTGLPFDSVETFPEDVRLFGLEERLETFRRECERYGLAGLKRRDELLIQYICSEVQKNPLYWKLTKKRVQKDPVVMPPFTIATRQYQPSNVGSVFISIDIVAAVFQIYHREGVIAESTWEEFLANFTTSQVLRANKAFRNRVLGKLDRRGHHMALVSESIANIWHRLRAHPRLEENLVAVEGDEILLRSDLENYMSDLDLICSTSLELPVRVLCYRLDQEEKTKGYVRRFLHPEDRPFDVKCLDRGSLKKAYRNVLENP
jgi:hypothetical protein